MNLLLLQGKALTPSQATAQLLQVNKQTGIWQYLLLKQVFHGTDNNGSYGRVEASCGCSWTIVPKQSLLLTYLWFKLQLCCVFSLLHYTVSSLLLLLYKKDIQLYLFRLLTFSVKHLYSVLLNSSCQRVCSLGMSGQLQLKGFNCFEEYVRSRRVENVIVYLNKKKKSTQKKRPHSLMSFKQTTFSVLLPWVRAERKLIPRFLFCL